MKKGVFTSVRQSPQDDRILYLLFGSVFLPYYLTALVVLAVSIFIAVKRKIVGAFEKNNRIWIMFFFTYTVIVSLCYRNWVGLACSIFAFLLLYVAIYVRMYITPHSFEKALTLCCICGPITGIFCFAEYLMYWFGPAQTQEFRAELYFFNSNYLASILGSVIILCAYKVVIHKKHVLWYFCAAALTALGAYLSGSMFVWIEVAVGCAVLLLISRQNQLLSALLLLMGTGIIILYFIPEILPRIEHAEGTTNNRIEIWNVCLDIIRKNPLFGRGFLTYFHTQFEYPGSYFSTHSHNLIMETILSFGVIGTIPLSIYFFQYFKRVFLCHSAQSKYGSSVLILALTAALLVHSIIDLTFMWIQTGLFFCLILGSIGLEERLLKLD